MTYETQEMNGYIAFYIAYALQTTGKICIVRSTDGGCSFPDGTFLTNTRLRIEINKRFTYDDFIDAGKIESDSLYEIDVDAIDDEDRDDGEIPGFDANEVGWVPIFTVKHLQKEDKSCR